MHDRLDALERRLASLEAREEIRNLIATYGPLADSGQAEAVAALWTADGEYEVVGFARARGRDAIAGLINGPTHQALMAQGCAHVLAPVTVSVDGDRATAIGHSVVLRSSEARGESAAESTGSGFEVYRVSANRWTLARTSEGWRVVHRANAMLDGNEAARLLMSPHLPQP